MKAFWTGSLRFLLLCSVLIVGTAQAETVRIKGFSAEGQGWLFGFKSRGELRCFVAVPRHVIKDREGRVRPFSFISRGGKLSESAQPVVVGDVPGAAETAGSTDLAFAQVAAGQIRGCLSRLGLPRYVYDILVKGDPALHLISMNDNTFATIPARISGGLNASEALLVVRAERPEGEVHIKPGISGTTVLVSRNSGRAPLAMILKADPITHKALALRFDRIKAAFKRVEPVLMGANSTEGNDNSRAYDLTAIEAITLKTENPVTSLKSDSGCWRAAAPGGRKDVRLAIWVPSKKRIQSLKLIHGNKCGSPVGFAVDQRSDKEDGWSSHSRCKSVRSKEEAGCRIDLTGPRELRLRISTSKPIALQQLLLE